MGQSRGVAGAARGGDAPAPDHGAPPEGSISSVAIHFGREATGPLNFAYYGTGLKGAERERLEGAENAYIRPCAFYYADKGGCIRPECGTKPSAHTAELQDMYDAASAKLGS